MAATTSTASRRFPTLTKYDVLEELGHGGMATVYRARDKRLGRDVALKVIHPHLRDSKEVSLRFFVEAKAVAKLRHPNIVEVYDVSGEDESEQYLVVELLRGKTLRKLLRENGAVPPEVAAALAIELLGALGHAHECGVVHRDVKPENVILEHRLAASAPESALPLSRPPSSSEQLGDRVLVKLTDFGIAKLLDAQGVTSTGQVLGSPAHMAPEQIEGGEVDARADVFGMGVLLYECMVGHLPFVGNNPAQVLRRVLDGTYPQAERERPAVGKAWSAILDRALARRAEDRYANAGEMREALYEELKRVGVSSPRGDLEAWFDGPAEFVEDHAKRMIATLCALGSASRRSGDAITAAADYNRALAYAPDDPQLLKIVAGMHRVETRARIVRRLGPLVIGALALGVIAFFVTGALRPHPKTLANPVGSTASAVLQPNPTAPPSASTEPAASVPKLPPSSLIAAPSLSLPKIVPPVQSPSRMITISKVRPHAGVLVAVDGDAATEAASGKTITLSNKAHALVFTCIEDLCEPQTRAVNAGDAEESIEIELKIKPAKLTIVGDPSKSYVIKEKPLMSVLANFAVDVPMTRKTETLHVRELLTDREVTVTLTAGQASRAVFGEEQ